MRTELCDEPLVSSCLPARAGAMTVEDVRDPERWNALLLDLPCSSIEQAWQWGEIVRASGWRVDRRAVVANGRCIAAISAASWRLPLGGPSIVYACRGPLVLAKDEPAWTGLMQAIREIVARTAAIFVRVSPGASSDPALHDGLVDHGFQHLEDDWTTWNSPRIVVMQDITASETELLGRLRKNTRQDLSVARRRGVVVRPADRVDDLHAFHRTLVTMGREKHYPVRAIGRLEAMWRHYVVPGEGALLVAERAGTMLGGLMVNQFGRRAHLQCAAVLRATDKERLPAGPLLYWELIRWAKARGCDTIDWGGAGTHFPARRDDPGYGLYRFKASFGSRLVYAPGYYDLVFRPGLYRAFRFAEHRLLPLAWQLRGRLNR